MSLNDELSIEVDCPENVVQPDPVPARKRRPRKKVKLDQHGRELPNLSERRDGTARARKLCGHILLQSSGKVSHTLAGVPYDVELKCAGKP